MNKTDKEYIDAQIENLEERVEKHIKNLYEDMCNKHPLPKTSDGKYIVPVGFTQKDGEPLIIMDPETMDAVARNIVNEMHEAQLKIDYFLVIGIYIACCEAIREELNEKT